MAESNLNRKYRMPAEWSHHSATMLIWPHNRDTWPEKRLEAVEKIYHSIITTLLKYEPVLLFVNSEPVKQRAIKILGDLSSCKHTMRIVVTPVNDVWARDSGPIFVKDLNDDSFLITDWEFNSWGGKYAPWSDDNKIPAKITGMFSLSKLTPGMVLEGGAIETNGEGLFITTESVLLNKNRNPELSKEEIEDKLAHYLGAEKVIWLKAGLKGDDTDGHIDDLTRFTDKNTIVSSVTDDASGPNYEILQENLEILRSARDIDGNPLEIHEISLPDTRTSDPTVDGSDHVPASYANFYIANGAVLLPLYDEKSDQKMVQLFSELFPGRVIEGIPCSDLVWGQGSIHCITQQLYGITL
ncbi:agmatine deiminase family protein [Rhodohalobacter sp. SW132]|uniref:agmatine deiminase family protein n=1 Tax=Rhodohalobacter sp. SW132 TaxID=2293433 RepID=UPI000E222BFA|nr:agmatine deiminase family protein [Rhodohalobacter sp. SW132]REL38317.1 agmatine deiminase family protein [Rhodohalobacter sp. SW132]